MSYALLTVMEATKSYNASNLSDTSISSINPKTLKEPMTMMLLGQDRNSYHWEGPFGLPFETRTGGQLYGWLTGWTRKILDRSDPLNNPDGGQYLLLPESRRSSELSCLYLLNPETETWREHDTDEDVFVVVNTEDGSDGWSLPRNWLFQVRENPEGGLDEMKGRESPYAVARFPRVKPRVVDVGRGGDVKR